MLVGAGDFNNLPIRSGMGTIPFCRYENPSNFILNEATFFLSQQQPFFLKDWTHYLQVFQIFFINITSYQNIIYPDFGFLCFTKYPLCSTLGYACSRMNSKSKPLWTKQTFRSV